MHKNVIIYCRVSTSKQSKTGESLSVQEEECRDYCKRNNYQVMAVFSEQYTGTKDKRPKIEEALKFIKNFELTINHIIVLKIDRVGRGGISIHDSFKKQFKDIGVTLKDVYGIIGEDRNVVEIEGINTDKYNWSKSNTNQIAENMTVMMSENERNTILQRMLGQAIKNNKRGYKVRNSDYGFRNKKVMTPFGRKTIQVENPEEAVYIKKMFELKARGDLSDKKIAEELNIMGFKSREKVKWNEDKTQPIGTIGGTSLTPEQLQRYIKMPVYTGVICEEWTGNKAIKTPYAGLVSIDLWNRANRGKYKIDILDGEITIEYYKGAVMLEEAPIIQRPKNYNPEYMFGKVLKCPQCEGHLTAEKSRSKDGTYHYYYSCRGKKGAKHKNYGLRRDEINHNIVNLFSKLRFTKKAIALFNLISEKVYEERKSKHIENSNLVGEHIKNLVSKKSFISENLKSILNYPDLLESQNEELQKIKLEITSLQNKQKNYGETLGLERFKKCSKKILEHLDKLVLQKEKPEIIQLAFDVVFDGNIEYEKLKSRTPITHEFLALNTKKEFQNNGNSSLNDEWWATDSNYQTIERWIVNLFEKMDKWQYVIDKINF